MCKSSSLRFMLPVWTAGVLLAAGPPAQGQEALRIGESYALHVDSTGGSDVEVLSTASGRVYEFTHPSATYLSVHFKKFHLAAGDSLIVSDAKGGQAYVLESKGKMNAGRFWSQHIKGDTIVLELVSTSRRSSAGFVIDEYAAGFDNFGPAIERICGSNDFENAVCRSGTTEYDKGRAVARLLIQGMYLCTGWLASADSHFITNEHCITSSSQALNTDYEFMAETPNCGSGNCQLCYGGTVYSGSAFIQDSPALDYALVQLSGNPASTYGYLQIDDRTATVGEVIYMPAHPAGRAKEFGFDCNPNSPYASGRCRVTSTSEPGCSSGSYNDVGYWIDTEGGSSGSPVLAASSHKVIALHHCHNYCNQGGWENRGVPIDLICAEVCGIIGGGGGCQNNGDCDDGDACTTDVCSGGSCSNTPIDCDDGDACTSDSCSGGSCINDPLPACCGNGTCDGGEDSCNCPADCGSPPGNETNCTDGVDEDCDGATDCADGDCSGDPACAGGPGGEGFILSKNADFSTDDRTFTRGETLYMKMWSDVVDFNDLRRSRWELQDPPGDRVREPLTNHFDGNYTASFALSGLPSAETEWTWEGELRDNADNRYRPSVTITVLASAGCSVNADCDDGDACTTDVCSGGTCSNTPIDCDDGDPCTSDTCSGGACVNDPLPSCCGDGTCDAGEDSCNCPADCGNPPGSETNCSDGIDEDCDGATDCADADCSGDPACAGGPGGEGFILSKNADFSTDDRTFTRGDTLYMKMWSDVVDFNDLVRQRWELKDSNKNRVRQNFTNHFDGTYTASFGLSGLPSSATSWTWKGEVKDGADNRYKPSVSITVQP